MKKLILTGLMGLMVISVSALQVHDGPYPKEGEACSVKVQGNNGRDYYENGRLQHFENRTSGTQSIKGSANVNAGASVSYGIGEGSINAGAGIEGSSSTTTQETYSGYECATSSGKYENYEDGHKKSTIVSTGSYLGGR